MKLLRKLWQRGRALLPVAGFHFDRPLVVFQSDDWGRVGVRDQEGAEQLRSAGITLGERPYDFYTLETAEDVAALKGVLTRHADSVGRRPCLGMNFVPANLDFAKMKAADYRSLHLLRLADGFPAGWRREGLIDAYRDGISGGTFCPALHGSTHFCRSAVARRMENANDGAELLRKLWEACTPYIHWRMPWIGYEYWDPGPPEDDRFLPVATQKELIGQTVGAFAKLFSALPRSACAPGYRANDDTHRAWAQHGIHIAQNGPGALIPPHFDRQGMLHIYRTVEFEPATDSGFSLERCLTQVEESFRRGIPAIVSVHSINFHSTLKDFRSVTLQNLETFLATLESRYSNLLYLSDEDLWRLANHGVYSSGGETVQVNVTRKKFIKSRIAHQTESPVES